MPSLLAAISWLILTTILLCMPGSAIPKDDWLSKTGIDKWAHIVIFFVLVWLWIRAGRLANLRAITLIILIAILYGVLMEFVQLYLVPNRSFDAWDIAADAAGSLVGGYAGWHGYKKNRPL